MLEDIKQSYISDAARIKGWEKMSVNTLCNLYIDNEDDSDLKSAYFSAILLKKWPYIGKHYANSKASGFSIEECYDMVIHGIQYALEKRKWRDPDNKLYNDKCGPDKVLNRCIASSRDIQYYLSNTGKRKGNFGKVSLDYISEEVKDCTEILADDGEEEKCCNSKLSTKLLIETLINKNKYLEALIVESILNDDCFIERTHTEKFIFEEEEQKVKRTSSMFKAGKLVDNLYKYREQKVQTLCDEYNIKVSSELETLMKADKNKISRLVKSILKRLSEDEDIREYLCS